MQEVCIYIQLIQFTLWQCNYRYIGRLVAASCCARMKAHCVQYDSIYCEYWRTIIYGDVICWCTLYTYRDIM